MLADDGDGGVGFSVDASVGDGLADVEVGFAEDIDGFFVGFAGDGGDGEEGFFGVVAEDDVDDRAFRQESAGGDVLPVVFESEHEVGKFGGDEFEPPDAESSRFKGLEGLAVGGVLYAGDGDFSGLVALVVR